MKVTALFPRALLLHSYVSLPSSRVNLLKPFKHNKQNTTLHRSALAVLLILKAPVMKTAEFANSVGPNEAAHYEPSHHDLHCLSSIVFEFLI